MNLSYSTAVSIVHQKESFFEAVATAAQGCTWHHWSDIDYGGFSMLGRLRREINSNIKPYRMDRQELQHYKNLTASITSKYAKKLERLLLKTEPSDCQTCIKYMFEAKKIRAVSHVNRVIKNGSF